MKLIFWACGERINKQIIRKYLVIVSAMMKIRHGSVKIDYKGMGCGLQLSSQRDVSEQMILILRPE